MPATIYGPPEELGPPPEIDYSLRGDIDEILAPEREWEEQLKDWCREFGSGTTKGEEVRWPRGDGYARYVVYTEKPLALIHIPTGDAWQIDDIMRRGLRLSDIRDEVNRQKRLAEIFGSRRHL